MRKKFVVTTAITAAAAGTVAAAVPAYAGGGDDSVRHRDLILTEKTVQSPIDLGAPGTSLGDEIVFSSDLFSQSGERVGTDGGYCVIVRLGAHATEPLNVSPTPTATSTTTTAAAPETSTPAAPPTTTAAAPETSTPAAPPTTTTAAPETSTPAAPPTTTAAAPETSTPAASPSAPSTSANTETVSQCNATLIVKGSQLTVAGLVPSSALDDFTIAVTGGTGRFTGAGGTLHVEALSADNFRLTVKLTR